MSPESKYSEMSPYYLCGKSDVERFSQEFNVPADDILLMGLNLSGIHYKGIPNDRGRYWVQLADGKSFRMATTITSANVTNFSCNRSKILLGQDEVLDVGEIEKDTCTDTYWRTASHLTLNSNARSLCKGCDFCGTYQQESEEKPLVNYDDLAREAQRLSLENDFSKVDAIGVVTGCFRDEVRVVRHLKDVRRAFSEVGFAGEIQYIGSQVRSEAALEELVADGPTAMYLTLEIFSNRDRYMKKQKSSLDLDTARQILNLAKNKGVESSFLYIVGIDSLNVIREELPKFKGLVTRLPQFQTFQLYSPEQARLRAPGANSLNYFLEVRRLAESTFPDLRPMLNHNYRGLWYTQYREEIL